MAEFIFLMHDDSARAHLTEDDGAWEPYVRRLVDLGCFSGGSAIGPGVCVKKSGLAGGPTSPIVGFIRVQAQDLEAAQALLPGNPVYEAGGTVEIRQLTP